MAPFSRFVALGDSFTEGLDDPHPRGGYRGWADRLAEHLERVRPGVLYANLAVRGRKIAGIHEQQLGPALQLEPDLATVMGGTNDVLRPKVDLDEVAGHMEAMQRALVERGATVVSFTIPNPAEIMPVARLVRDRIIAFNAAQREVASRTGALLLDMEHDPNAAHPDVWSVDRLHANSLGHKRTAAALAELLGIDLPEEERNRDLPAPFAKPRHQVIAAEIAWLRTHFAPWIGRRLRGRSSGDDVEPKRPSLMPVEQLG
jgi:lysophospholipase L1-like esterase